LLNVSTVVSSISAVAMVSLLELSSELYNRETYPITP